MYRNFVFFCATVLFCGSAIACQDAELQGTTLTITCPGVNLEGKMVPGAVGTSASDANTGRPVSNLQYPQNQAFFDGARVYLCLQGSGWTCGAGSLRGILSQPNDRPFASGTFQGGKAVIQLPRTVPISELSGVVVSKDGTRGWLHRLQ